MHWLSTIIECAIRPSQLWKSTSRLGLRRGCRCKRPALDILHPPHQKCKTRLDRAWTTQRACLLATSILKVIKILSHHRESETSKRSITTVMSRACRFTTVSALTRTIKCHKDSSQMFQCKIKAKSLLKATNSYNTSYTLSRWMA